MICSGEGAYVNVIIAETNIITKTRRNAKANESQLLAVKPHLGQEGSKKKTVRRIPNMLVRKKELDIGTMLVFFFRVDTIKVRNKGSFFIKIVMEKE